jgi:BNR/Asp-box repeat protein
VRAPRYLAPRAIRRSIPAALFGLLASASIAFAATSLASRPSPFADCTDGQSEGPPPGQVFVNAEVEPWVDVNPTNGDNVIGVWQQDRWTDGGSHGLDTAYSMNGGGSWSYPTPIPWSTCAGSTNERFNRATDPWVSFGPTGDAHAIALTIDGNGFTTGILASKSEDGGATWSDPIVISDLNDLRIGDDKESITADPTDSDFVYAIWDRIRKPGESKGIASQFNSFAFRGFPFFARSTDGGETWEAPRRISSNANLFTIGNQIVVLPNGTLIDFTDYATGSGVQPSVHDWKAVFISTDKGETWTPKPVTISQVFEVRHRIPDGSFPVRAGGDDIAVDPSSGALYAVWTDGRFGDGTYNDVVLSKSTDGGQSWTSPVKVSQNPAGIDAHTPSVRVNADGDVAVSYYDYRNDNDDATDGVETDFWFEVSSDGGATWTQTRLTPESFDITGAPVAPASRGYFLGDYEGMSSFGSTFYNLFVVATGDPDNRTDVRFATVTP